MAKKRIHILSTVNAANVSKAGSTYTIRDVCGAVDDIVMNGMLYPAEQLANAAPGLSGKPAPAGHPKNKDGKFISAANGEALLTSYIGSVCTNARHEGGRTLVDIVVNEKQARASDAGAALIERLDAAIANTNSEPIHVSTGLFCEAVNAGGESRGKAYQRIATNIAYDHLAILLNEKGAGTPEDGVGMFLNSDGSDGEVEAVRCSDTPVDHRSAGLMKWIRRLVSNSAEPSFDDITSGLYALMADSCWIRDVFDRYCVWTDRDGKLWRQDYSVSSDGSVAFSGQAVEVHRTVSYEPVTNHQEDSMKAPILAALNAAGIKTDGLDETQLLAAYNKLVATNATAPLEQQLTAANSKIAGLEADAAKAENAERDTLAAELATNSDLTADDFKAMPVARLRELKAKAAPIVTGNGRKKDADEFAGYDLNADLTKEA